MPNWWTRRCLFQCAAVALVLCAEWLFASVRSIDESTFDERATELERTGTWRYGYVQLYHGAILVKTALVEGAPPLAPIDADDDIAPIMAQELRMVPRKAAFEIGFYAALWALWGALSRLRRRLLGPDSTRWRRSAALGVSWALMITTVMAPLLLAGYGEPLFSTWQGPGALSYSSAFGSTVPNWGPSFTYRGVLMGVFGFPILSLGWTLEIFEPHNVRAALWLLSVVFYALASTGWKWIIEGLDRRGGRAGGN